MAPYFETRAVLFVADPRHNLAAVQVKTLTEEFPGEFLAAFPDIEPDMAQASVQIVALRKVDIEIAVATDHRGKIAAPHGHGFPGVVGRSCVDDIVARDDPGRVKEPLIVRHIV